MRTIFIIPKMFTKDELSRLHSDLPEDFDQKSKEFWDYIEDRIRTQRSVQRLYYDSLVTNEKEKGLEFVKSSGSEKCYDLVSRYLEAGAELEITEDPVLVQEAAAWASMLLHQDGNKTNLATEEMLAGNVTDRDKYIAKRISESLKDGETGILFLAPGRRVGEHLAQDIRVIKVQPFDPSDYLNSWVATMSLRSRTDTPVSSSS